MKGSVKTTGRRCAPGQQARIVYSSNEALKGRVVRVERLHCDGRWECVLVGDPVLGLADDGIGLVLTRDWLFPDSYLEPLVDVQPDGLAALAETPLPR
ncbi:hypothetical protein FAZ95_13955 [Trinickia violacea]|uniref:Uncharacterized protein n=1 Tax=Trinickia violacea TaxID=2571746 RepID=A0A4P8IQA4_9BURK|nr:hypothetical protein FAZ95_13955 [Trinickia violacea]